MSQYIYTDMVSDRRKINLKISKYTKSKQSKWMHLKEKEADMTVTVLVDWSYNIGDTPRQLC